MKKKYVIFQSNRYLKLKYDSNTERVVNPLEATMYEAYADALRVRNHHSGRASIPAEIHSIQYTLDIEKELNSKLIELDQSQKRLEEIKLTLEDYCR